jgi:hypothetical protein
VCNGAAVAVAGNYLVAAAPVSAGTSGTRFFGTSEAQTVFQHTAAITAISAAGVPAPGGVPIK